MAMNYSQIPLHFGNNNSGYVNFEMNLANGSTIKPVDSGSLDSDETMVDREPLLKQDAPVVALFTVAYGIVLLLAVVNNCLVVTAIYRNQQLRTVTNMFIANLAVADITVSLLILPITLLTNLFTEWQFGAFLCRAIPYLQAVAVGASCNTLVAVAVERYLAIFHVGTVTIRPNQVVIIISVIWLLPSCVQIPWAVFSRQEDFVIDEYGTMWTFCYQLWPSVAFERGFFLGVVFLTCYLIPLCFLAVFYTMIGFKVCKRSVAGIAGSRAEKNINRSKIRIVRMLVVVTTTFALSWLPLYTIRVYTLFGPALSQSHKLMLRDTIIPIAQWMGSANSCVNPFIYCYFSEQFRRAIVSMCKPCCCCKACIKDQGSPRSQSTRVVVVDDSHRSPNKNKKKSVVVSKQAVDGRQKHV